MPDNNNDYQNSQLLMKQSMMEMSETLRATAESIKRSMAGAASSLRNGATQTKIAYAGVAADISNTRRLASAHLGRRPRHIRTGVPHARTFNKRATLFNDFMGMVNPGYFEDVEPGQAEYYSKRDLAQRGQSFMSTAMDVAITEGLSAIPVVGPPLAMAYYMASPISKHYRRNAQIKNMLDRSFAKNILAGKSQNIRNYRGLSDKQMNEMTLLMNPTIFQSLGSPDEMMKKSGFSNQKTMNIVRYANANDYYKGVATVKEFKKKTEALLKGTKEMTQILHTTFEESVGIISQLNKSMGGKVTGGFTQYARTLQIASAYSGRKPEELLQEAIPIRDYLVNNMGFDKKTGMEAGLKINYRNQKEAGGALLSYFTNEGKRETLLAVAKWNKKTKAFEIDKDKLAKLSAGKMNPNEILTNIREILKNKDAHIAARSSQSYQPITKGITNTGDPTYVYTRLMKSLVDKQLDNSGLEHDRNSYQLAVNEMFPGAPGTTRNKLTDLLLDPSKGVNYGLLAQQYRETYVHRKFGAAFGDSVKEVVGSIGKAYKNANKPASEYWNNIAEKIGKALPKGSFDEDIIKTMAKKRTWFSEYYPNFYNSVNSGSTLSGVNKKLYKADLDAFKREYLSKWNKKNLYTKEHIQDVNMAIHGYDTTTEARYSVFTHPHKDATTLVGKKLLASLDDVGYLSDLIGDGGKKNKENIFYAWAKDSNTAMYSNKKLMDKDASPEVVIREGLKYLNYGRSKYGIDKSTMNSLADIWTNYHNFKPEDLEKALKPFNDAYQKVIDLKDKETGNSLITSGVYSPDVEGMGKMYGNENIIYLNFKEVLDQQRIITARLEKLE